MVKIPPNIIFLVPLHCLAKYEPMGFVSNPFQCKRSYL